MKFSDLEVTSPYLTLSTNFYDKVDVTPLINPFLISTSQSAASLLDIDEVMYEDEKLLDLLNGALKLSGSEPFAMCYAGHQFGEFSGRLGDGRAINLGKSHGQNLQLKGAGLNAVFTFRRWKSGTALKYS